MTVWLDLNADLGEGCGNDAALMEFITSCNIACGGHAGDETTMRHALELARDHSVAAGAHPSFPDRETFGRALSTLTGHALEAALIAQVETLQAIAEGIGVTIGHLKPHGALYNMAAFDRVLSESVLNVMERTLPGARLVGPPGSALQVVAGERGVNFFAEGFADRAYEADGRLRDRTAPGALIETATAQVRQATDMALHRRVTTHDGSIITLAVDTICVHGDTPSAVSSAKQIREALEQAGVTLCPAR